MNEFIYVDFDTMGTTATVTMGVEHSWRAASLRAQMEEVCRWFDHNYSTYQPDSTLQKLRAADRERSSWPQPFQQLAKEGSSWELATAGHFTMTGPTGQWDPTGLVKAKAIESLAILLHAQGITEFSVNIGGDIRFSDHLDSSALSRVAINRPVSVAAGASAPLMVLDLAQSPYRAIATSGSAERGEHIWTTSSEINQATVVARDIETADVWATALVSGGEDALQRFIGQGVGEALVLTRDQRMIITTGISPLIAESPVPHELQKAC